MADYKIGTYNYKIKWVDEWVMDVSKLDGAANAGRDEIVLSKGCLRPTDVFFHEVIHLIDQHHNLGLSEQAVEILATHILAFFKENDIDVRSWDVRNINNKELVEVCSQCGLDVSKKSLLYKGRVIINPPSGRF